MKRLISTCLLSLVILSAIYALMNLISFSKRIQDRELPVTAHKRVSLKPKIVSNGFALSKQNFNEEDIRVSKEMRKRIDRLYKCCKHQVVKNYKIRFNQTISRFYYLKSPSLTYCKVPKAGSTFWTSKFLELNDTREKHLSNKSREFIHAVGKTLQQFAFEDKNSMTIYKNSINLLVSRDPYTRLISAYMDKYNLLGHNEFARSIVKKTGKGIFQKEGKRCGYNVSFQDFLDHVVNSSFERGILNRHWAPVFILCHPCNMPYHYLSKQETLTQDTKYILKTFNLSKTFVKSQNKELQAKKSNAWNKIFSIMKTFFKDRLCRNRKLVCPDLSLYLEKIWRTLQSQGKISDTVPFPKQKILRKGNNITAMEFSEIIYESIKRNPMTARQKNLQRRRAVVKYYRNIKPETINRLKQIYSVDFLLFGYNSSPPV